MFVEPNFFYNQRKISEISGKQGTYTVILSIFYDNLFSQFLFQDENCKDILRDLLASSKFATIAWKLVVQPHIWLFGDALTAAADGAGEQRRSSLADCIEERL